MLIIQNVNKVYKKKIQALKDINIELPSSGLVFIDGDSGSGKSTLLNIISTLEVPDSGELIYKGKTLSKKDQLAYLRNDVSIIFQDANLFTNLTVMDNLAVYEEQEEAENLLKYLGLEPLQEKKVKDLSGGEKRRVAIARAILKKPCILLCDEPTSSLDRENAIKIFDLLKNIAKEMLVIVSSHDEDLMKSYADRIIELKNGEIVNDNVIRENKVVIEEKNKKIQINTKFLNKVAHDLLFSNKLTFVIGVGILTFFLTLILASNIMATYDYVKMQIRTLAKEKDDILIDETIANYKVRTFRQGSKEVSFKVYDNLKREEVGDYYYFDTSYSTSFTPYQDTLADGELIGHIPTQKDEIVLYQIAAEAMSKSGILLNDNTLFKANNFEDLIGKSIMFGDVPVRVSGIITQDATKFLYLKDHSVYEQFDLKSTMQTYYFDAKLGHYKYEYLVSPDFFAYMSEFYPFFEYNGYLIHESNKARQQEILSRLNNKQYNIYTMLVNDSMIDIYGTIYSDSMAYIITLPFLIGNILLLFLPIAIIITIYVTLMFFENIIKKNRHKVALILGLGCSKKDVNYLMFKALTTYMGVSFLCSIMLMIALLTISSIALSKVVGFYFQPFSVNNLYILLLIAILAFTFVLTLTLLQLRVNKKKTIMYLKNN